MGGAIYMHILGALEVAAMLSIVCVVGVATRRNKRRMYLSIIVASVVLCLGVRSTRHVRTVEDWVYLPITSLYDVVRNGH
jgi:NADH:ubiquinone oxidoreductase subunit K